ncbi:transcriptional regulator, LysR family [Tistlia consotensis]|uniref:Transcriptional regulator, LysR family n=1 Tax=Tistlia consotensis USBA 355 TaxID=560819 RepID=A0A1Y6CU55_9PROT|nr:transcriptional regulator GcvA [Tistlia consotensis]SMF74945.1 transcriptional regulator, LysR family [Tistlia consotensis USBA 355]SNS11536.1 transcriptional regulator, LysR family [Tistlia consotensis]
MPDERRRLPSLTALRAFEAAARHRSLTRAAEELSVTPAAVSHQVKLLEQELGVTLLRRDGRGLAPSETALAALPLLGQAFEGLRGAVRLLRPEADDRILTISVVPSFASTWLLPRLESFQEAHPEIDVRIGTKWGLTDFLREEVDLAIRYGPGDYPGLFEERLFAEEFFPVCSPRLLGGPHPLHRPEELVHHRLLHVDSPPDWRMWLQAAGVEGIDASRGPRFYQTVFALQAAEQGQGVAIGTTALVQDLLAAGRLVKPFELSVPHTHGYYLVCPPGHLQRPKVAAFADWVRAAAREGPLRPAR